MPACGENYCEIKFGSGRPGYNVRDTSFGYICMEHKAKQFICFALLCRTSDPSQSITTEWRLPLVWNSEHLTLIVHQHGMETSSGMEFLRYENIHC